MISRPNVRGRCLQPNLQAQYKGNRKYYPREYRIYAKPCRWCKRPASGRMDFYPAYPGLCGDCGKFLMHLENDHHIFTGEQSGLKLKKLVLVVREP